MENNNTHANLFSRGASPPPSAKTFIGPPVPVQQQPVQQEQDQEQEQSSAQVQPSAHHHHHQQQPMQAQMPPPQQQQQQVAHSHHSQSPARSLHELPSQVSNPIDSLFHNMAGTTNVPFSSSAAYPPQPYSSSAPATPMSNITAGSGPSMTQSTTSNPNVDRQNALLSLLSPPSGSPLVLAGQPGSMGPAPVPLPVINHMQQVPTQVPTPPGSSQQVLPPSMSHTETSGKNLLEQLMAGNSGRRGSQNSPASSLHNLAPSPPYGASPYQPLQHPVHHNEPEAYFSEPNYMPNQAPRELPQPPVQQQQMPPPPPPPMAQPIQQHQPPPMTQQPMSPPQQTTLPLTQHQTQPQQHAPSMFDFVSPFDAFTNASTTGSIKKKPAPVMPPPEEMQQSPQPQQQSWVSPSMPQQPLPGQVNDPKRKSMENILDQLTRRQPIVGPSNGPYESYLAGEPLVSPPLDQQAQPLPPVGGPVPPIGKQHQQHMNVSSPRASPPKMPQQQQQQRVPLQAPGGNDSGLSDFTSNGLSRRSKDSSPGPRGSGWREKTKSKSKNGGQSAQPNVIVFDVSQPLEEVQASRDCSKSTPIALVKVEPSFLPGTTIGATHWVAYGMSKGRVRVISRSSGDRTLLTLPPPFPPNVVVCDMAVHGNRLAGVTSDGGFVVWELPEQITDDVPGRILLCVYPSADAEALLSVKWHPRQPDQLAVGSENKIHLLNILDAVHVFGGDPIPSTELHRIGPVFPMPSPLAAFDFDVHHYAIGTISVDSTLTLWGIRDMSPFWTSKIRGDDIPSSVAFINGGVIIGRRNGTVYQLLPDMSKNVSSTLKFVNNTSGDDPDMFGHANYDARIHTLWIANNRRDSLVALKIGFEQVGPTSAEEEQVRPYFDQLVEFVGPKPTIHFVILTADADPTGEEAHAACVAAKVPPGDLALVAFSVHASGVDQLLIRREWFESGFAVAQTKFPMYTPPQLAPVPPQPQQQPIQPPQPQPQQQMPPPPPEPRSRQSTNMPPPQLQPQLKVHDPLLAAPARPRTPPSEEVESENAREEARGDGKGKGKSRNAAWKEQQAREQREKEEQAAKEKAAAAARQEALVPVMEVQIGTVLAKEVRKLEDNLHTRIGRLVGKELDKQHQRMEEARVAEQQADFVRQEKILKLISSELTKNTTRVVEMAVKSEVQNSVLPSLQDITKSELKAALNGQLARNLSDAVKQTLPAEIERMFMRPDVTAHLAMNFTSSIQPVIEHHVKETMNQSVIPTWKQQTAALHQEFSREVRSEMLALKKDISGWQNEALRTQEAMIRDLEQSVRVLTEQVKFLTIAPQPAPAPPVHHNQQARDSPSLATPSTSQASMAQYTPTAHLRQATLPMNQPTHYQQSYNQQAPPPPPPQQHQQWYSQNIAAPQASHPAIPPPVAMPPPAQPQRNDEWDDTYLHVLEQNDIRALHGLLSRSDPDVIMPLKGGSPLSQAVILTLVSRFCNALAEMSPIDDVFGNTIWWLQRTAVILDTNDPVISSYIPRVLPGIQQTLNQTRARLTILPGASPQLLDAVRSISDVQSTLSRKPMQL